MAFRDQILRCAATGKTFVWTVAEQRERVRKGLPLDPPLYCPEVRAADVRLAGDLAVHEGEEAHEPVALEDQRDERLSAPTFAAPEATGAGAAPSAPQRQAGPARRSAARSEAGRGGPRGGGARSGPRGGRGGRSDGGDAPPQLELRIRHIGTVKWFDAERGFGFVVHEEGGELFLHGSSLLSDTIAALREGTPVEYEVVNTTRGRRAVDVVPLA